MNKPFDKTHYFEQNIEIRIYRVSNEFKRIIVELQNRMVLTQ